jgi:hypothetical protein
MYAAALLVGLAGGVSPSCGWGYSCCCLLATVVPVSCECVEDEPLGKDNCPRDDGRMSSLIADTTRHVCRGVPRVSRAQLEAREEAAKQWVRNATDCAATCKQNEAGYYDSKHCADNDPKKGACTISGDVQHGCQCVCQFPNGRDQYGACVPCPHGYVQRTKDDTPPGPGAKAFKNGEFHCASEVALVV